LILESIRKILSGRLNPTDHEESRHDLNKSGFPLAFIFCARTSCVLGWMTHLDRPFGVGLTLVLMVFCSNELSCLSELIKSCLRCSNASS